MKRLDQLKPKADALIRYFWYPDNCTEETGMRFELQYFSPSRMTELGERIKGRFQKDGKKTGEAAPGTVNKDILNALLLEAIIKIEFVTYKKLQGLVEMDADGVSGDGGVDSPVAMDPTNLSMTTEARANILYLLEQSNAINNWVLNCCQNLALFQSSDWEARVKNSKSGRGTSGADSLTGDQAIA